VWYLLVTVAAGICFVPVVIVLLTEHVKISKYRDATISNLPWTIYWFMAVSPLLILAAPFADAPLCRWQATFQTDPSTTNTNNEMSVVFWLLVQDSTMVSTMVFGGCNLAFTSVRLWLDHYVDHVEPHLLQRITTSTSRQQGAPPSATNKLKKS
jgi:hypothetical protein